MRAIIKYGQAYWRAKRGSVVEFVFVLPFIFMLTVALIDAGNLFVHYRKAQQLAESIVRAARSLDVKVVNTSIRPLDDSSITILRNVAARMQTQAPERVNYVWIGRFVRPNGSTTPLQLLPAGLQGGDNQGIVLAGKPDYAAQANTEALDSVRGFIPGGEIVYVVDVTFSYNLMSPVPDAIKKRVFGVRYAL